MWWQRIFRRKSVEREVRRELSRAVERLKAGDAPGAKEAARTAVQRAAAGAGERSPPYVEALFNEAMLLAVTGDVDSALASAQSAAAVPPAGRAMQKDRLTHLLNFGEVLTEQGRLDEAERVLRSSLDERKSFYGIQAPGYAWGLSALAQTLYFAGRSAQALELVDQAVNINLNSRQPKVADDLALRAFIVKSARGLDSQAFDCLDQLPPLLLGPITQSCLERTKGSMQHPDPAVPVGVLRELLQRSERASHADQAQVQNVQLRLAELARMTSDQHTAVDKGQVDRIKPLLVTPESLNPDAHALQSPLPALGLVVVYAMDLPAGLRFLNRDDGERLGLGLAELHRLALENLRHDFPREVLTGPLEQGSASAIQANDLFNAARLLVVPELLAPGQELVALIPHRDMLVLAPSSLLDDESKLREGMRVFECASHPPLLDRPVRVSSQGFAIVSKDGCPR
jgi:tetratricopeptide (TPR) repeat protein